MFCTLLVEDSESFRSALGGMLRKNFPDRFNKVWNQVCSLHGGNVNDSQYGRRITGEGNLAEVIHQLYRVAKRKYLAGRKMPPMDLTKFRRGGSLHLFETL